MTDWDLALETLASILHCLSRNRVAGTAAENIPPPDQFGRWATHLLSLTEPPGLLLPDLRSESGRNWRGLEQFITRTRIDEVAACNRTLTSHRSAVTCSIDLLLQVEQELDQERASLEATRRALQSSYGDPPAQANPLLSLLEELLRRRDHALERLKGIRALLAEALEAPADHGNAAHEDPLTNLESRQAFDGRLARAVSVVALTEDAYCLLLVEIDGFHALPGLVGDTVLVQVARLLTRQFPRRSDFVARYDREAFAVLLRDARDEDARRMAERVRQDIGGMAFPVGAGSFTMTVSIGVASHRSGDTVNRWTSRAVGALYDARRSGGDQVVVAPLES